MLIDIYDISNIYCCGSPLSTQPSKLCIRYWVNCRNKILFELFFLHYHLLHVVVLCRQNINHWECRHSVTLNGGLISKISDGIDKNSSTCAWRCFLSSWKKEIACLVTGQPETDELCRSLFDQFGYRWTFSILFASRLGLLMSFESGLKTWEEGWLGFDMAVFVLPEVTLCRWLDVQIKLLTITNYNLLNYN